MEDMTKVIMLGTGTPDPDPDRSGPCVAIVCGEKSYIVDFGANITRQANKLNRQGITALRASNLQIGFLTHLHVDHTLGYPDLIMTPWICGRKEKLVVYGPKGLKEMTDNILRAYHSEIDERLNGHVKFNPEGGKVEVHEIVEGVIYQDELVKVEAIPVNHGEIQISYAYKFYTPDKTIVISGDTSPCEKLVKASEGCDILVHEVYPTKNLEARPQQWKDYHSSLHTSSLTVGEIAATADVKKLVLYHPVYLLGNASHQNKNLQETISELEEYMVDEVKQNYSGEVYFSKDLDIFE